MFIHYAEVEQPKAHAVRLSLEIPHFIHVRVSTRAVTTILVGQLFFLWNNIINTSFPGGVADDGNLPFTSNEIALSVVTLLAKAY